MALWKSAVSQAPPQLCVFLVLFCYLHLGILLFLNMHTGQASPIIQYDREQLLCTACLKPCSYLSVTCLHTVYSFITTAHLPTTLLFFIHILPYYILFLYLNFCTILCHALDSLFYFFTFTIFFVHVVCGLLEGA